LFPGEYNSNQGLRTATEGSSEAAEKEGEGEEKEGQEEEEEALFEYLVEKVAGHEPTDKVRKGSLPTTTGDD